MGIVIRKLTKKLWLDLEIANELGGLQGDALKNFATTSNTLSLFYIDDTVTPERVAAVIALGRNQFDIVDYALFDEAILGEIGLELDKKPGTTVDVLVNGSHVNVVRLTAEKVRALAERIQLTGQLKTLTTQRLIALSKKLVADGAIALEKVNPKLLPDLCDT